MCILKNLKDQKPGSNLSWHLIPYKCTKLLLNLAESSASPNSVHIQDYLNDFRSVLLIHTSNSGIQGLRLVTCQNINKEIHRSDPESENICKRGPCIYMP